MEEFKFNTEEIETPKFSEEIFNIKDKKLKTKKIKEIPDSPFKTDILANYYGSKPILVKWKHWVLMCNLIRNSDTFKKLYAKENFKYGDLEETAFVVYPVFTKEPQTVKNLDGKIIEEISGIYDEENTLVLPPKFIFPIYRRYFLSSIELAPYLNETQPEIMNFEGYNYVMNFGPRGEQLELAEMAGNALKGQKYFKGIIQAAPGWGKAELNSTLLPTPNGKKRMGDIKVGDQVFGRHGKTINVAGVFPQGSIPVWEVKFDDGTSTFCNAEHLWGVYINFLLDEDNDPMYFTKQPLEILTTKELKEILYKGNFIGVPLCKSLEAEELYRISQDKDYSEADFYRAQGQFVIETNNKLEFKEYRKTKIIEDIVELGYTEEQTCIMVDDSEHLYLSENFTVTHNTYISINIGSQAKGQVLVIVPNNLLAGQWKKSILEFTNLTEDDIGMIKGSDLEKLKKKGIHKKPFNIVLIQSLDSQLQRADFNELIDFYKNTSIVFYDETHTSGAADGYAKTSGIFTTYNILGLSATPYKKDKNLFQLYTGIGQIVYISTHQNLIPSCNMHLLDTPITQKEQRELFDIFQKTNYNFFMSKLEDYLFKVDAYFVYIAEWLIFRYKQGFSTVVLFKTNKMLEKLQIFLNRLKGDLEIKSTILTNETAKKNQKELGSSNVILSNYKMFSAGADYPFLSCIFFASMVLSKTTLIQSLGRVTRKHDTKIQEVQAHFLIPKFIYPLYSNNEPHITIVRGVKVGYPTAQFKWDKGFTTFFDERKKASENLNSNQYASAQYPGQQIPNQNVRGDFIIQPSTQDLSNNRLEAFRQHKQMMESINKGGTGLEHIEKPKGFF